MNHWDPNIRLHDDVIDGRFHSNTEIGLAFSGGIEPRFFGKVTTAASSMTYDNFGFASAARTCSRAASRPAPNASPCRATCPTWSMAAKITIGACSIEDTRIIFNSDGSYVWRLANGEGPLERAEPSEQPQYLIGEKGAKLYVRGTVSGIFTVYSPTDIEIEDDLTYCQGSARHADLARLPGADFRPRHPRRGHARSPAPATCTSTPRCLRGARSASSRWIAARPAAV